MSLGVRISEYENIILAAEPKRCEAVLSRVADRYVNYQDPDLCLAVCDFIARNYKQGTAEELLRKIRVKERSKQESLRGFADDGLRIAAAEAARIQSGRH